jgi:hypothetical protein
MPLDVELRISENDIMHFLFLGIEGPARIIVAGIYSGCKY